VKTASGADPGPTGPGAPAPSPPHDPASVLGREVLWRLHTERGRVDIVLDPAAAPWHVAAIVALTRGGFYDGLSFHRVVPGYVVQGGDPDGTGWGGPGFNLPSEPGDKTFARGAVGIADAGKDTGGSQFFVMHARAPHLDGRYTRVGEVRDGLAAALALVVGDRIVAAEVTMSPQPPGR
jgi:cyclophilin family peptidyl-prolyl cis-trans isomerase